MMIRIWNQLLSSSSSELPTASFDTTTTTNITGTTSYTDTSSNTKHILYRFSLSPLVEEPNMDHGTGVCVTCSQWKVLPSTTLTNRTSTSNTSSTTTNTPLPPPSRHVQTTPTIIPLLPIQSPILLTRWGKEDYDDPNNNSKVIKNKVVGEQM